MGKIMKYAHIIFTYAVFSIILFSGCSISGNQLNNGNLVASEKTGFSNITPEEAKKRMDGENGIIVLDVRTKEEYETGHLKGSILIPVDKLEEESQKKLTDKEATILIYCRSGNRSVTAAKILSKQGYKNIYNLGGINDWPYDIEK